MESKEKKKLFGITIFVIFVILFLILLMMSLVNSNDKADDKKEEVAVENHYGYDYKYALHSFFGEDCYIYLLKDNRVKLVTKSPIAETCSEQNCMQLTGEYHYEEFDINFEEKPMKKVREFIESFFKDNNKNYVDLEELELSDEQDRILLSILLINEDELTVEDDLNVMEESVEFKNSKGEVLYKNTKTTIMDSENLIVQNIANYLNGIVLEEWEKENQLEDTNEEKKGVSFILELKSISPYYISMIYKKVSDDKMKEIRGYTFNSASGDLKEMLFKEDEAYKEALENFKKTDIYLKYANNLDTYWETTFRDKMFLQGNYYTTEEDLVFIINPNLFIISEDTLEYVEVKVDKKYLRI